jgi:putative component of toxin-antitoxin plasmid stabilization module
MQQRQERVLIETARHRISGMLTLARDGYRSRISDVLNAQERDFISLTDCVVELVDHDGPGTRHEFVVVSRRHVIIAIPENPQAEAGSQAGAD